MEDNQYFRKSDPFVIALWAAFIFGLIEGLILNITRAYPVILAPYKTSAQVLWIAPLLDIVLYLAAAVATLFLLWLIRHRIRAHAILIAYGIFGFLGFFTVLNAPKLIHPISAAALSLGLSVVLVRSLRGKERKLTDALYRKLFWVPVILVVLMVGVAVYSRLSETVRYRLLAETSESQMNVLVIIMDTVRYDRFTRPPGESLTPNIDRITQRSIRYDNAWPSTSWTLPSHGTILTGYYPDVHCADWPTLKLNDHYPTLGEFFAGLGYVTGAFSGNSAWVTPEYLGRGFLRFQVYLFQDQVRRTSLGRGLDFLLQKIGYHAAGLGKKAPQSNQEFLDFLDDYPDKPFFVLLNYMDVNQALHKRWLNHGFWEADPPMGEVSDAYDDGLHMLDSQIGDLFDNLKQRSLLDNTLIIITSDHGESFGTSVPFDHDPVSHGTSLYVEQLRVPLFILLPGENSEGKSISQLVSLSQLPVTLTNLLDYADINPFPGVSLPTGKEDTHPITQTDEGVASSLNYNENNLRSLVWDEWQYIDNNQPVDMDELFNLRLDPYTQQNVASGNSLVATARSSLDKLFSGSCAPPQN